MPLATDNIARFISHGVELQQSLEFPSTESDQHIARNIFLHSLEFILKSDAVHRCWVTVSLIGSLGRHKLDDRAFCQRVLSAVLQCHIAARSMLLIA